jgi:transposase
MEATVDNHDCPWRTKAEELIKLIEEQNRRIEQLERMLFGKRSEKMPSVRSKPNPSIDHEATQEKRKDSRAQKQTLPEVTIEHKVHEAARHCQKCGSNELKKVGAGRVSVMIEYVPARLERQVHIQETLACPCGEYMVTASGPTRPTEGGSYGAGFLAHVVTAKCCDSIPLYRMEKQFKRLGISMSRSTLCNLFHQAADALEPIYQRMLSNMPAYDLVLADETPVPVQAENKTHKGYMWSFINKDYILYRYSRTRSGLTPSLVLKDSKGTLLADAFSGYNRICTPDGRTRAGCWAHARRKFFEAKDTAPEAQLVLDYIKELYQIEYDAAVMNILGTHRHVELRQQRASPILNELHHYLREQQGIHPPKSPMAKAIGYVFNNWDELCRFINDANLPLDNNASERALRIIALGRKNYLFVGNDAAAENLAGLYSLVATCELHGINPEQYLTDVMIRVHTHPQAKLDDLMPHKWKMLVK